MERARRTQDERVKSVGDVAEARQRLTDERAAADRERVALEARIKEQLRDAEAEDLRAFNRALKAGWTSAELKQIGFPEPEKKRARRRAPRAQTAPAQTAQQTKEAGDENPAEPDSSAAPVER